MGSSGWMGRLKLAAYVGSDSCRYSCRYSAVTRAVTLPLLYSSTITDGRPTSVQGRYSKVMPPLLFRYITVAPPLHHRYITVTRPLQAGD